LIKEMEDSLDPCIEDRLGKPDYTGNISQNSWEWDIVTREDMRGKERQIGGVYYEGEGGSFNSASGGMADMTGECDKDKVDDDNDDDDEDIWDLLNSNCSDKADSDNDEEEDIHGNDQNAISTKKQKKKKEKRKEKTISAVWNKLAAISAQLKVERKRLRIKEEEVLEREERVVKVENHFEDSLDKAVKKWMRGDFEGVGEDFPKADW